MQDREIYHASAVEYNETLAVAAEKLTESVADPTVKKWCRGIAKLHRYHLKRHRAALAKIQENKHNLDRVEFHSISIDPGPNAFGEVIHVEKTVAEQQAEFAAQQQIVEDDIALEGKD